MCGLVCAYGKYVDLSILILGAPHYFLIVWKLKLFRNIFCFHLQNMIFFIEIVLQSYAIQIEDSHFFANYCIPNLICSCITSTLFKKLIFALSVHFLSFLDIVLICYPNVSAGAIIALAAEALKLRHITHGRVGHFRINSQASRRGL